MHQYTETRKQSEDLLCLNVGFMEQQLAPCNPQLFTLGYEHFAGINPPLSRALNARSDSREPLVEAEVRRFYSRYIERRDLESSERLQAELTSLVRDTAGTITEARSRVAQYQASLHDTAGRLSEADTNVPSAHAVLAAIDRETKDMLNVMHTLMMNFEARADELKKLSAKLGAGHELALTDALTGLKNRRGLEQAIEALDETATPLRDACAIVCDVDHFKRINDSYGHITGGDMVLRAVAAVLQATVKGRDVAARLGGEEFAVILPATSLAGATTLAEQIRGLISHLRFPVTGMETLFGVTVSLGVAAARDAEGLEELLTRADAAMYEAKRGGRDRVCVTEEERTL